MKPADALAAGPDDRELATAESTVASEKEGYDLPPRVYPGIPESLPPRSPPFAPLELALAGRSAVEEGRWSRLGWERKPGCWLDWSREEVEEEESRALPTLSPRLSWLA